MLLLFAVAQLTAADILDLRCVHVFETAATAADGEERAALKWTQHWFEGRLSARQPQLNIYNYIAENFSAETKTTDEELEQCSEVHGAWVGEQIAGHAAKRR